MLTNDLKWPYTWQERHVSLVDQALLVPDYCPDLQAFGFLNWSSLFERELPVRIEYCSGNGEWILEKAKLDRNSNWIAIDKRFERLKKIWRKVKKGQISNLFLCCAEGLSLTRYFFKDQSVDEIFINFPDPWPKTRHKKNRIINADFLKEVHRVLKRGSFITLVTDDEKYAHEMILHLNNTSGFKPQCRDPYYILNLENYGNSYFDALWRSKGKDIYTIIYQAL